MKAQGVVVVVAVTITKVKTEKGRKDLAEKAKTHKGLQQSQHNPNCSFPQTSRTTLYQTVMDRLGYLPFCARWLPKQMTDFHKTQRMGSALTFLQRYWEEREEFLDRIVTGDETWVQFMNVETTKEQSTSKQWMHTHSPHKPKKFKRTLSNKKMATVFWDHKGNLLTEFMASGTKITSEVYCETLNKLRTSMLNKRGGMLSKGVVLLHDNARSHTAARTNALNKIIN
jgi:hypothetical protein